MYQYQIQTAAPGAANLLSQLCQQTFAQAYETLHSKANLQTYSAAHHRLEDARQMLTDCASRVRIAYQGGQPVGFCVLRQTASSPLTYELQKLYLLESQYGAGLGQQLFDDAVNYVHQQGAVRLWLYVSDKNPRAKQFYLRQGFREAGSGPRFYVGTDELSSSLLELAVSD